jgi:carbon-monoxide dehydrogenase medium subunit
MIPGSFAYHRPKTVQEAVALLARLGDDARPLAGVDALKGIRAEGDEIVIGAMTTQHDIVGSELLAQRTPLLRETSLVIADPQVRYCGTLGGNVANGDPGNDMPAVMIALDARYVLAGPSGERQVAARDFYKGVYFTELQPGEVLTAVRIKAPPAGHGYAYEKLKRKVGDYATAAAAVVLTLSGDRVTGCAIGLTNVAECALFAEAASNLLVGSSLDPATVAKAVAAAEAITTPASDRHGPAVYRTKMAGVMLARALARAKAGAAH